jgi:DNA-3-methyladenine glycosylase II
VSAGHPPTPERFLKFTDARLKEMGFSRQKISYGRNLADAIVQGSINLFELNRLDDAEAKARLMEIKGIGSWTADIYLLRALGRPDIWPRGDLALAAAVQKLKGMSQPLSAEELYEMSGKWRPWRAVAARLLWHFYLKSRP